VRTSTSVPDFKTLCNTLLECSRITCETLDLEWDEDLYRELCAKVAAQTLMRK
jgi:hypothetical protein